MSNIGFIGTGIMGQPMAQNLQAAGHHLFFSEHYKPAPAELLGDNGTPLPSPKSVMEAAEFIILMLPDTFQVKSVLFDTDGVFDGLSQGKIVIDMSSISPLATKEFALKVNTREAEYIDAPVSGGDVGAKAGTLTIMCGGSQAAFDKARPLFEAMGRHITLVGGNGDGQTCKVANQIIVALNLQAVGEALMFVSRAGADPAKVREALMGGFASSRVLEVHGERMLQGNFEPGFRVSLHQKDLDLALSGARSLQLALPHTCIAQELFNSCAAMGESDKDHSSVIKVLEQLSNHSMGDCRAGRPSG